MQIAIKQVEHKLATEMKANAFAGILDTGGNVFHITAIVKDDGRAAVMVEDEKRLGKTLMAEGPISNTEDIASVCAIIIDVAAALLSEKAATDAAAALSGIAKKGRHS